MFCIDRQTNDHKLPIPYSAYRHFFTIQLGLTCITLLTLVVSMGAAQDTTEPPEPAVTHVTLVDEDFALQGEFIGQMTNSSGEQLPIGLQIAARGSGQFEAVQYMGGLPGHEFVDSKQFRMIGRRAQDLLVLSGASWAVFVKPNQCTLIDSEGQKVGQLQRITRTSPTIGALPPENAIVLFEGSNVEQLTNGMLSELGDLKEGADFRPLFHDFNLHLEFALPYMPESNSQDRGNSGVYLQSRYEVQILDSFGMEPENNRCGGLYKFRAPTINMCFPPLVWQTYDIAFTSPRWASDGTKLKNARVTVWHNGVKVHDHVELPDKTGAGKPESAELLPTRLQDHGDPVRYRNIWIVDRGLDVDNSFPVLTCEHPPDTRKVKDAAEATSEPETTRDGSSDGSTTSPSLSVEGL